MVKYIFVVVGVLFNVDVLLLGGEYVIIFNEVFYFLELLNWVVVVGGGYIVVEFVGIFNGLGVDIILIYWG